MLALLTNLWVNKFKVIYAKNVFLMSLMGQWFHTKFQNKLFLSYSSPTDW